MVVTDGLSLHVYTIHSLQGHKLFLRPQLAVTRSSQPWPHTYMPSMCKTLLPWLLWPSNGALPNPKCTPVSASTEHPKFYFKNKLTYKGNSITLTQIQANSSGTLSFLAYTHKHSRYTPTGHLSSRPKTCLSLDYTNSPATFIKLGTLSSSCRPFVPCGVSGTPEPIAQVKSPPQITPPATRARRAATSWTVADAPVVPAQHAN